MVVGGVGCLWHWRSFCVLSILASLGSLGTSTSSSSSSSSPSSEFVVCRSCGEDVADSHYFVNRPSPHSPAQANITLFGRPDLNVQVLVNPLGVRFKLFTSEKALCTPSGTWVGADTWFPGHRWRYCVCRRCSKHLGWLFRRFEQADNANEGFYALILDRIVGEKYADSLIASPEPFRS